MQTVFTKRAGGSAPSCQNQDWVKSANWVTRGRVSSFFQRNRQVSLPGLSKGRYTTPGASRTRIAGMISDMGKIGWENIPPRITARNAINPPQHMAQQLGFPDDVIFSTVYCNGQPVMPFTLLLYFSFAIVFSILFILLIQKWKQVGMAQGAVYGLIIWVAWHVILMPLFGTVPAPWDQPFEEHFSEILGHVVWAWSIAATVFFLIKHQKANTLTYLE